mgnify:CR=1 FL=1
MKEKYYSDCIKVLDEVGKVVIGKDDCIRSVMAAVLAEGHILIDDVPGVGKTSLATAFAKAMGLENKRTQFTSDVMPADITGFNMYDNKSQEFIYQPGPVMCNFFLADEINRTSPKTQSALLEVMEEKSVTVDGVTRKVPEPFIVIATQNPEGSIGTQLLPESQLDRFMICISMGYPSLEDEIKIAKNCEKDYENVRMSESVASVIDGEELLNIRKYVKDILVFQSTKKLDLYNQNELEQVKKISTEVNKMRLVQLIYQLSELQSRIKWSNQKSVVFQAEMIKLCAKPEEFAQIQQVVYTDQVPVGATQIVQRTSNQVNNIGVNNVQSNNIRKNNLQKNISTKPEIKIKASSEGITKAWPNILGSLKNNGRIVLYTNLINTQAKEINDMTVGIEFSKGLTPFGKTVLEKQENVKELTKLVSMACGKEMNIKYIDTSTAMTSKPTAEQAIQDFASDANIPFNIID